MNNDGEDGEHDGSDVDDDGEKRHVTNNTFIDKFADSNKAILT